LAAAANCENRQLFFDFTLSSDLLLLLYLIFDVAIAIEFDF
jgi:hypothetical protein